MPQMTGTRRELKTI